MKQLPLIIGLTVALLASLAANAFQHYRYSSSRPIMVVAGQPITRKEYQDQLDYTSGKAVLNKLAYRDLIQNAAQKAGVEPTEADIDTRIADIERRNPQMLAAAKSDPTKMDELRQDLKTDLAFENLRMKDVQLSDADLQAFYDRNKAAFALPTQAQTTIVAAGNSVDADTAKSLLAQGMKPDVIARQPRLRVVGVGGFQLPPKLPPAITQKLNQAVFHMKEGDVSEVQLGPNAFVVIRLNSASQGGIPPLSQIKPLVTRVAKLSKAPPADEVLAKLYKDANVHFEVDKYAAFFSDIQDRAQRLDSAGSSSGGAATTAGAATPAPPFKHVTAPGSQHL